MMSQSCSIGGRSGDLAGQRNTLTPYRACWITTGMKNHVILLANTPRIMFIIHSATSEEDITRDLPICKYVIPPDQNDHFSLEAVTGLYRYHRYNSGVASKYGTNHRTFTLTSQKFAQQNQNIQQLISYDDIRLQKHLQFLNSLYLKADKNESEGIRGSGFSFKVLNNIHNLINEIETIKEEIKELEVFVSDLKELKDDLYKTAVSEKEGFENKLNEMKKEILQLIIPEDIVGDKDIILELSAGVGGQEAMLFARDMFEMYCHYACWKGWDCEILKFDETDIGGIKNAHIAVSGQNAFKIFKFESGVHRVQRVPKTEKAGRIHTSTMTVAVLPQPTEIEIVINPNDIELEFKRSGGAGGQHVNTTDSCVRIYHKPSGKLKYLGIVRLY
ncbi:peptide chain release factor 1-like, mitochondrial [Trichonephila clavipes]|nr:peptide chain release factor 1-like, mitochondrial [Trichonephila clavipes]